MTLPLALSCGDPAGIGPEIAAAAWRAVGAEVPFVYVGDPGHLAAVAPHLPTAPWQPGTPLPQAALGVVPVTFAASVQPGRPDPANAAGTVAAIETAVRLVQAGQALAVVTNPISKQVLRQGAGFAFPGHTEYLGALCGGQPVMMLAGGGLRVVPVTIHVALAEVPRLLTSEAIVQAGRITAQALERDFGIARPRLAVAGLNPHAGEGGMMGDEEPRIIAPAIAALQAAGIDARGPLPADTLFHARARAQHDAVLCMYHDQALIPLKTLAFDEGVNVTLGLPIVRTSPDHGTAFDIAGKGTARPDSLIAALRLAREMGLRRLARAAR